MCSTARACGAVCVCSGACNDSEARAQRCVHTLHPSREFHLIDQQCFPHTPCAFPFPFLPKSSKSIWTLSQAQIFTLSSLHKILLPFLSLSKGISLNMLSIRKS